MTGSFLHLHRFLPCSRANGPGQRAVLWVQGCALRCPGCFNPQTHPFADGELISVEGLFDRLTALDGTVEGVTISGGEPLQQCRAVLALLQRLRQETALSVLVFTGFTWEEVLLFEEAERLLSCMDVLIAGRYDQTRRLARDLRGSASKTVHFLTERYGPSDLQDVPAAEIVITPEGDVLLSGADPVPWSREDATS